MSDPDPRSDQELVQAANRADADAFEAIYLRYRDWTFRLAYRFTRNEQDALDVLQDAFAYLLGKFPGFALTARMTTFLYPVVKHIALAKRRRRQVALSDEEMLAVVNGSAAASGAVPSPIGPEAERSELAEALGALNEAQREVLLMRFLDAMSLAEIAQTLGIPLGTVKSRMHHGLETLRADPRARRYFEP